MGICQMSLLQIGFNIYNVWTIKQFVFRYGLIWVTSLIGSTSGSRTCHYYFITKAEVTNYTVKSYKIGVVVTNIVTRRAIKT